MASGEPARTISIYNIHTKETLSVVYKRDGKYIPEAMKRINWVMRDWRLNKEITIDPELVDLLWQLHTELGSKVPIHLICGYRSHSTNEMLRRTRGGQAQNSQHIGGKAADIEFPDVPLKRLRYSALIRERGGVGYYPSSGQPFVHVDTARVRHWPRMPRYELALLFPEGHSRHVPSDGDPLRPGDARKARSEHPAMARDIADLQAILHRPVTTTLIASARHAPAATPPARKSRIASAQIASAWTPKLVEPPREVSGPTPTARKKLSELFTLASMDAGPKLVFGPTRATRPQSAQNLPRLTGAAPPAPPREPATAAAPAREAKVAAVDPAAGLGSLGEPEPLGRFGWGAHAMRVRWAASTEFDEEHPDELSYRPFPIAPLLTEAANAPVSPELVPHDATRTLDVLTQPGSTLQLHFAPSQPLGPKIWTARFEGSAMGLDRFMLAAPADGGTASAQPMRTSAR